MAEENAVIAGMDFSDKSPAELAELRESIGEEVTETEPVEVEATDVTTEPEAEAAPEEQAEPEPPSELDLIKMQLEEANRQAEHFKTKHDKLSGRFGKELADLRKQIQEQSGVEPEEPMRDPRVDSLLQSQKLNAVDTAVKLVGQQFASKYLSKYPQSAQLQISEQLKTYFNENESVLADAIESGDADEASTVTESLLTKGFLKIMTERAAASTERQRAQQEKLQGQKELVTPIKATSTSDHSAEALLDLDPSDIDKLSDDDLKKLGKQLGRQGF